MGSLMTLIIVCYLFYIQCIERAVKPKRYIILPIILILLGYSDVRKLNEISFGCSIMIIILSIIFLVIGIISGIFIKFYKKTDGILYEKGGIISGIFLIGGIILKEVFIGALSHTSYAYLSHGDTLLILLLGFQFGGRGIMVILREPRVWKQYLDSRKEDKKNKLFKRRRRL